MLDRRLTFVYFIMRFHSFLIALRPSHPDAGKFRERRGFQPFALVRLRMRQKAQSFMGSFGGTSDLLLFLHFSSFAILCLLLAFSVIESSTIETHRDFSGDHYEVGEERFVISHPASRSRRPPVNVRARN